METVIEEQTFPNNKRGKLKDFYQKFDKYIKKNINHLKQL